jgi:hypothetical protein
MPTVNDALAEMIDALGYTRMASEARRTRSKATKRRYARFIVRELRRRKQYANATSAEAKFKRLEQLGEL